MKSPTITIENTGPVHHLSIPVPPDGGVVVLRGHNGAGKSKALEAVEALTGKPGVLTRRDGQLQPGVVSGLGVTLKIGARTTKSGELEVDSLEDRLRISDLVDPQVRDAAAADAKRIKALIALTGVKATAEMFAGATDAETFGDIAGDVIKGIDDPLVAATAIKGAFQAEARDMEELATRASADASAAEAAIAGVDLEGECDAAVLQAKHTAAVKAFAKMDEQARAAFEAVGKRDDAQRKLQSTKDARRDVNVVDAKSDRDAAAAAYVAAGKKVADLEKAVAEARIEYEAAGQRHKNAELSFRMIENLETIIAQHEQAILELGSVTGPTQEAQAAADQAVQDAAAAMTQGNRIRAAREQSAKLAQHKLSAKNSTARALKLRAAAAKVDEALSKAVACPTLRVEGGRLVTDTARGPTFFSELSEGERWRVALDIAIPHVGEGGIIVINQIAWESLDPVNRQAIADQVKGRKITVLAAESADGDLRAEPFNKP